MLRIITHDGEEVECENVGMFYYTESSGWSQRPGEDKMAWPSFAVYWKKAGTII